MGKKNGATPIKIATMTVPAHNIAVKPNGERDGPRYLTDNVEGQHEDRGLNVLTQIARKPTLGDAKYGHCQKHADGKRGLWSKANRLAGDNPER